MPSTDRWLEVARIVHVSVTCVLAPVAAKKVCMGIASGMGPSDVSITVESPERLHVALTATVSLPLCSGIALHSLNSLRTLIPRKSHRPLQSLRSGIAFVSLRTRGSNGSAQRESVGVERFATVRQDARSSGGQDDIKVTGRSGRKSPRRNRPHRSEKQIHFAEEADLHAGMILGKDQMLPMTVTGRIPHLRGDILGAPEGEVREEEIEIDLLRGWLLRTRKNRE